MELRLRHLVLPLLLLLSPLNAQAARVEFESTCNTGSSIPSASTGRCDLFGLSATDTVSGFFTFDDSFFTPGFGTTLVSGQYDFFFEFGNQTFTEADSAGDFGFLVDVTGSSISSILAVFDNPAGARLLLLTPATVVVQHNGEGADTFGQGSIWRVTSPSAIPVPAAAWLFATALGFIAFGQRHLKSVKT